jgi:Tfp pilus assembly protein PilV
LHQLVSRPHRRAGASTAQAPPARGQEGLTLVEVLVASVVLMIGILGVMAVFPQSISAVHRSNHTLVLNQLANEKLEELRALDYDHADLAVGVHPAQQSDSRGARYYPVPGFSEDYSLRWTVRAGPTDGSGSIEANVKTVVVESTHWVRYSSGGVPIERNASLSMQFQTYVTRD